MLVFMLTLKSAALLALFLCILLLLAFVVGAPICIVKTLYDEVASRLSSVTQNTSLQHEKNKEHMSLEILRIARFVYGRPSLGRGVRGNMDAFQVCMFYHT